MTAGVSRIIGRIPIGDAKNTYEAREVQIFQVSPSKIPRGLSPFISFLSLANASSMPCDQLANSCSWTPFSKNSKRSCEIVTFRDFLLRFVTTIQNQTLHKFLNNTQINIGTAKEYFAEGLANDKNNSISESSERPGHYQGGGQGMPREQRGHRPRVCLGPLPPPGRPQGDRTGGGGLHPPRLAAPLGRAVRLPEAKCRWPPAIRTPSSTQKAGASAS